MFTDSCKINNIPYYEFVNLVKSRISAIIKISSNSPYLCIITNENKELEEICKDNKIEYINYDINNYGITII